MRVLLITNYFAPYHVGGAEVMVHNTCLGLRRRGVDASVLMINARMPETGEQQHELQGVPVHAITYRPYTLNNPLLQTLDPRVLRNVKAEIRRLRPDLVHVHNVSGSTLAPFVACDQLGVPVVLTLHDLWLLCPNNMLYKKDGTLCDPAAHPTGCRQCFRRYDFWANIPRRRELFRHLVRNVRLIICPSQKLADLHIAAGYDRKRLHIVPNGIPPGAYRLPSDYQVRKSVMDGGRFRTVLFAGGVVEIKGIQTLLEAIPLLSKYVDRFRLIVAGTGERQYMTALQDHSPTVKLVGQVPFQEMRSLYATADLTVIPSICFENSPMVVYESFMAGTPAVGSDIGGIPELIRDGATGYIFRPGDAVALTEQVIRHIAHSAYERRAMRRRCAEYARAHLSLAHYLNRIQRAYGKALRN